MDQEKRSLYQRIRNAKQSLENAEKSFQDDKGLRGELDLMLAEAELKNLRKKQPWNWSWNRHSLALSVAVLLVISGLGGWFFAKENLQKVEAVPLVVETNTVKDEKVSPVITKETSQVSEAQHNKNAVITVQEESQPKVQLSEKEMRRLVRSAKSELNSGK